MEVQILLAAPDFNMQQKTKPLPKAIRDFIKNRPSTGRANQWFKIGTMQVYMRHSVRHINGINNPIDCVDIGSVETSTPGKGQFSMFLAALENFLFCNHGTLSLYVENVMSSRLQNYFRRRAGYEEVGYGGSNEIPCFLRRAKLPKADALMQYYENQHLAHA